MDEKRLKAFEDMLAGILKQYDDTTEKNDKAQSGGQGENSNLPPAFYKQVATSNDLVVLPDIRTFG